MRLELNDQKYRIIKIQFLDFNDDNSMYKRKKFKSRKQYATKANRCYRQIGPKNGLKIIKE